MTAFGPLVPPTDYTGFGSFPTKPPQQLRYPGALALPAADGTTSLQGVTATAPAPLPPFGESRPSTPLATIAAGGAPGEQKHGLSGFFDRFMNPTNTLGQLGRALIQASGTPLGDAYQIMDVNKARQTAAAQERAKWDREGTWHEQERQDHVADQTFERSKPVRFSGSADQLEYDPVTHKTTSLYDAPTAEQSYASALGLQPGTKEYDSAVQDYALRANGPTAAGFRSDLEDQRFGNRSTLKGTPTYRDTHRPPPGAPHVSGGGHGGAGTMAGVIAPVLAKVRDGKPLTPGEQQAYDMYKPRRGSRGAGGASTAPREGTVIVGPGGHKQVLRGGKWVPAG